MWTVNKAGVSLIVLGAFLAGMPKAQAQTDQQVSVADAARRSREQKKDASKPAAVITNDTLEPAPSAAPAAATAAQPNATSAAPSQNLAVTAAPDATASSQAAASSAPAASPAPEETPQEKAAVQSELKALKQQIAEMQLQVDLVQRALSLANDDFYSRPDFSKDEDGKAKLDALKAELTEKQQALADLKAKLPSDAAPGEKPAESQTQPADQPSSSPQPEPEPQAQQPPRN